MSPVDTSAIVFICVFGGAIAGMILRSVLPEQHLANETKDVVKLGVGLIGTMAALLLGLLVASAKSSYDAQRSEVTQMATSIILLDRTLAHYGPETEEVRAVLKAAVPRLISQIWQDDPGTSATPTTGNEIIYDKISALTPHTDSQRAIQSQAESFAFKIGETRWLLVEQGGASISAVFLVVVIFWLTILFASFGLFAPRNATVVVTLLLTALSVAGALFLVLELDHPFSGFIQISSGPLRNAVTVIGH